MSKSQPKVLIVEDNHDIQELYKILFEGNGYEVKLSGDGSVGLKDAASYMPDVILLDIMMPEMNGFEFLDEFSTNEAIKRIPVAVLTNLSQDQEKKQAIEKGASVYLDKSDFDGDDLVQEISKLIK